MKKEWLVKIKGEIKGPFTLEELKDMVSQGNLTPRDEVNKPKKSWVYAYSIKELGFVSENTETGKATETVPLDKNFEELEEVEKEDFEDSLEPEEETRVEEIAYVPLDKKQKSKQKSSQTFEGVQEAESYLRVSYLFRTIWQFILVVFLAGIVGVVWLNKQKPATVQNSSNSDELHTLDEARVLFQNGMYEKSMGLYKELSEKNEALLQAHDWMNLSELSIQKMDQLYESKRFLEKARSFEDFDVQKGHLLNGVIDFLDGNDSQAQGSFKQAWSLELSLAYQFILYVRQKNWSEAQDILNQFKNETSLEKFLSFVGVNLFSLEASEDLTLPEREYAQEISFVKMKPNSFQENDIQKFLDQNPYLIEEFYTNLLLPSSTVIWKNLFLETCSSGFKQMEETAYSLVFYAFCQAKSGLRIEAQELIDRGMKLYPKDPLVLSIYSYIFSEDKDLYQIYVDRALSVNKGFELPFILKARSCHKQEDYNCAYENWKNVGDGEVFYSKAGQAWALYFLDQAEEAFKIAEEGVEQIPSYLPFQQILFLKD